MGKKDDIDFSSDNINANKILVRILLIKLKYDEKIIDNVCEIIYQNKQ